MRDNDADAIAGAIAKLLKDEEMRILMGKNARKAAEKYNWEMESGKLIHLYEKIEKRIR